MMTRKWLILDSPIMTSLSKAILIMHAVSMLHNYCINERLKGHESFYVAAHTDRNLYPTVQINNDGNPIVSVVAGNGDEENIYRTHGHSVNLEMIASNIAARNLVCLIDSFKNDERLHCSWLYRFIYR